MSRVVLVLTVCLLLPSLLTAQQTEPKEIASVEGVTEYRLSNGARVLLFPDASKPTLTVNMTVLVGSRHEGYGEAGMAHLLEHMVFKGTPTFQDIPTALRDHGAQEAWRNSGLDLDLEPSGCLIQWLEYPSLASR